METLLIFGGGRAEQMAVDLLLEKQNICLATEVVSPPAWTRAYEREDVVMILAELYQNSAAEIGEALQLVRQTLLHLPFVVIGERCDRETVEHWLAAGADEYISNEDRWRLGPAVKRALRIAKLSAGLARDGVRQQMSRLITTVEGLLLAKDMATVQSIACRAARSLTGADGATLVLKRDDQCCYAEEDAIGPLWKGQCFPLSACVSGLVMGHKEPLAIENITSDPRIVLETYRPTFVKSLLMVPFPTQNPIGAIGTYWAEPHQARPGEIDLLQAVAHTTAVALGNIQAYEELESRVEDRTRLLKQTNSELETFSYSISHDLRSPITAILGFAQILSETLAEGGKIEELREYCDRIVQHAHRMSGLIRHLLRLAKITQAELKFQMVNLSDLAAETLTRLKEKDHARSVRIAVSKDLIAQADPELTGIVLENLLSNAWKYTGQVPEALIEFGAERQPQNGYVFFVRDNGAGFHPRDTRRLFAPFQTLHDPKQFAGAGVGLATVQRIIHKHGGRIWAEGVEGKGATFYFTLPDSGSTLDRSQAA